MQSRFISKQMPLSRFCTKKNKEYYENICQTQQNTIRQRDITNEKSNYYTTQRVLFGILGLTLMGIAGNSLLRASQYFVDPFTRKPTE